MELRLPAPSLIVLIGPSGSGKTTWANEHFRSGEIVSSDQLRAVVGTGEDDQRASPVAFDILERIVTERMDRRLTTVIDTLGLDDKRRSGWIDLANSAGIPVHAVVFDTTGEECERRNDLRPRPIPKAVIRKQISRFRSLIPALEDEGFDGIHHQQPVAVVPSAIVSAAVKPMVSGPNAPHSFGLSVSRFAWEGGAATMAERLADIARRAELAGFRDLWLMDHFRQIPAVGRPWEDIPEAYTALGYIAGVTSQIRLGTLVTGITYRNPALLGKMIATIDVLSSGRANCGLGIGWNADEHAGYGWDFPEVADRYALLEDTLEMLPLLWGKGSPSFAGRTFSASELVCYPRPLQKHIPITIGGSGERKTLALVARYADACNLFGKPETIVRKVEILGRHCSENGRDPAAVEVTHLTAAMVGRDRRDLAERIERVRGRDQSVEAYSDRNNAGTVDDLVSLFEAYHDAGATHSIVALPDVAEVGSLEAFGDVIARFNQS
ncbi:MAG TPA: TIGR03560 family F420-dependent LLM class oxidoreductase [Acidimicrobiia bacterium]